jgi:hypothetical protein
MVTMFMGQANLEPGNEPVRGKEHLTLDSLAELVAFHISIAFILIQNLVGS